MKSLAWNATVNVIVMTKMEKNKIYCMDCLEGMKQMENDSVDLVITDPPYGVRKLEEWDDRLNFINKVDERLQECMRISKNGVIWFCACKMIPFILENNGKSFHRILFWNKPAGSQFAGASNNNIWYSVEPILVFEKNKELRKKGKQSKYSYTYYQARTHKFDDFKHPAAKPYLLMKWLIQHYTNEGDLVLDPFAGSGTTLLALKQQNRAYMGFEINPEYIEIINKRLAQDNLKQWFQ